MTKDVEAKNDLKFDDDFAKKLGWIIMENFYFLDKKIAGNLVLENSVLVTNFGHLM